MRSRFIGLFAATAMLIGTVAEARAKKMQIEY